MLSEKGREAVYLFSFLLLYKISISKMFIAIHGFDFYLFILHLLLSSDAY